jgi:hypothetical protein
VSRWQTAITRAKQFDPRSVPGLALWLDGADTSTLYTTDAGPVTAVAAPTDISGCVGWWDASDAASITQSGGLVSQWNDKSGQGNHATASGTRQPAFVSNALNGKSVIAFDGADDLMEAAISSAYTAATVFAVLRPDAAGGGSLGRVLVRGSSSLFYDGATSSLRYNPPFPGATGNGGQRTANSSATLGAWHLLSIAWTGGLDVATAITPRLAGAVSSAGLTGTGDSVSAAGIGTMQIGNRAVADGGDRGWNGRIAELIFFNAAISAADRARVEAYLAAKWGISGVHAQATATSDPVGHWRDKSGNGRHFTQSVGSSRASRAAAVNGRPVVGFNGTSSQLTLSNVTNANLADASGAASFVVFRPDSDSTYSVFNNSGAATHRDRFSDGLSYPANFRGSRLEAIINGAMPTTALTVLGHSINASANTHVVLLNGAAVHSAAQNFDGSGALWRGQAGVTYRIGSGPNADFMSGVVCEVMQYGTVLNTSARQRIEQYLAAKWGITLAPQVSNADAQSWINRVYGNGGTVSPATASAVNTLCNSIDAAGIRDRFYRLGIFAGSNLAAALVPLYRGPAFGGTTYGNATDTNVGPFVSGDYGETGATGGLKGNGTSKYLRPGITPSILPSPNTDSHVACYFAAASLTNNAHQVGLYDFSGTGDMVGVSTTATTTRAALGGSNVFASATPTALPAMVIGSRTSGASLTQYLNGTAGTANTTSVSSSSSTAEIAIFARNTPGGGGYQLFSPDYIRAYSYGLSMTAAQAAAYNAAMQDFQTALGRNV